MPIDNTDPNGALDTNQLRARIEQLRGADLGDGSALEAFAAWLMPHIPGLSVRQTNTYSFGRASEIDLTLWNDQHESGFKSFAPPILVECKHWKSRVGAAEVAWFDWKLRLGGASHGFLITNSGVTGDPAEQNAAYQIIQRARTDQRFIIIIQLDELADLGDTNGLRELIIDKVCLGAAAAIQ